MFRFGMLKRLVNNLSTPVYRKNSARLLISSYITSWPLKVLEFFLQSTCQFQALIVIVVLRKRFQLIGRWNRLHYAAPFSQFLLPTLHDLVHQQVFHLTVFQCFIF